jgi:hypothetical protein
MDHSNCSSVFLYGWMYDSVRHAPMRAWNGASDESFFAHDKELGAPIV